ncbi:4-hydroxybenzoate polyprenyltransferase, mitochondrial [Lepeophtheirus salmonis]|uniref:4-hydroxybenzoate polyprenyltransferase, mitochondrial n=1 Tax=Lepeophtheirus salmonis TaxID=72036 RepID=UPI001AE4F3D0|nr:4-hydroxybenzoate polyprenyltransferase, mitochondrial-like [Lepeophtheirus salmonis]
MALLIKRPLCNLLLHRLQRPFSVAKVIVDSSPKAIQPYLKTMRADQPIGSWLLFWPSSWSIALATAPGTYPDPYILSLFALGSFVMRGAGCTINDMWDKDIDSKVARTALRPIAAGDISRSDALALLSLQLSAGCSILLQLNYPSILLGASSLLPVVLYPLMKRITYYPQIFLGLTFNWGALLGYCAVNGDINLPVILPLYVAAVSWTVFYDTIYAHQDKYHDLSINIKSTAIKFGNNTKYYLTLFSSFTVFNLLLSAQASSQSWPFYTAIALSALHFGKQISTLDIENPKDCHQKFVSNSKVGLMLFAGAVMGNYFCFPSPAHL